MANDSIGTQTCPGCGGRFVARPGGAVHRYVLSSAGCWATYGEVLAREYSDPDTLSVHRLTVDAYAVQHPGRASPQSIRSVALHLISLCACLEHQVPFADSTALIRRAAAHRYVWLEPPAQRGEVHVDEVVAAQDAAAHRAAVLRWAESAWRAWSAHHAQIEAWLERARRAP
jgi:Family of unknown function (DUF5946)